MSKEVHNGNHTGYTLKDIILGGQDGLVNVLGIVLAVATATNETRVVLIAGLAATFAESLSMGAVALTSSKAARDFYKKQLIVEKKQVEKVPRKAVKDVKEAYSRKGFAGSLLNQIVKHITSNKKLWVETMMQEELRLFPDEYAHPWKNALIVGFSSVIGSLIPLLPFFFAPVKTGVWLSLIITTSTLFLTGAVKAKITIGNWKKSGLEMAFIGLFAAITGYAIGLLLGAIPV